MVNVLVVGLWYTIIVFMLECKGYPKPNLFSSSLNFSHLLPSWFIPDFHLIPITPKRKYKKENVQTEGEAFTRKHKSHQLIGRITRSGEPFHY
jgi:hypothetical protein